MPSPHLLFIEKAMHNMITHKMDWIRQAAQKAPRALGRDWIPTDSQCLLQSVKGGGGGGGETNTQTHK